MAISIVVISYQLQQAGPSLLIEVNMQVRSMGPISEMDMVSVTDNCPKIFLTLYIQLELHNGLLLQTVLGGQATLVRGLQSNNVNNHTN